MAQYNLIEEGCVFDTIEADDADSALADAEPNYADYGELVERFGLDGIKAGSVTIQSAA